MTEISPSPTPAEDRTEERSAATCVSEQHDGGAPAQPQPSTPHNNAPAFKAAAAFPKYSIGQLLLGLFISPRLALLNARVHRMWFRTFVIILLTSCVAAVVKACQEGPVMRERSRVFSELCVESVGSLTCETLPSEPGQPEKYRFDWGNHAIQVPDHKTAADWRIDVVAKLEDLDKAAVAACQETAGMVIAHDALTFWLRGYGDDNTSIYYLNSLPMRMFADVFRQYGQPRDNAFELQAQQLHDVGQLSASVIAGLSGIQLLLDGLQMVFTCLIIFIIMSLLFQRTVRAPFATHVASAFACAIPPYLLANICVLIPAVPLAMDTLFTVFFLIYLAVIFVDRSVVIRRSPNA